jgi:hypothetical protein
VELFGGVRPSHVHGPSAPPLIGPREGTHAHAIVENKSFKLRQFSFRAERDDDYQPPDQVGLAKQRLARNQETFFYFRLHK